MLIQHNYLRMYRKKSMLTQQDLAFILDLGDYANVSRWEHGDRQPTIQTLLVYHLVFNLPIELLFERQKVELIKTTAERIRYLLEKIKQEQTAGDKKPQRLSYLETALTRLNALSTSHV